MAWTPPPDIAGPASVFPPPVGFGGDSPFTSKEDFLTYLRHVREMKPWNEGGTQVGPTGIGFPNWEETKEFWDDVAAWVIPTGKIVGAVGYNLMKNPMVRSYVVKKSADVVKPILKFKGERLIYTRTGKASERLTQQFISKRGELATIKATGGQFGKAYSDFRKIEQIAPKTVANMIDRAIREAMNIAKDQVEDYLKDEAEVVDMAWFTRRRTGFRSGGYGYRSGGYRRGYRRGYSRYGGYGRGRRFGSYRTRYTPRRRWY